ncbi:MAG TPA: methyltransferase domain-containing protein [Chthoniobacterales bacterium]|nr:methyltransferase domain-containing protein [Chthoniobacterales bacterium]
MIGERTHPGLDEILACPTCRGRVRRLGTTLVCGGCEHRFSFQDGVAIFLPDPPETAPPDHASNPIGPEFEAILQDGADFILNIGAGATTTRYANCVEFEHKIFRHTDVVGDAHRLPFRDDVFDRVFAFNVFEHLRDPKLAAGEIQRVLKPGGIATIHTAFLQALHEPPHHFFNATEFGVREWFSGFEIDACHVSGNFGPGVMLAFLMSSVLHTVRAAGVSWKDQAQLENTSLGEWADFWAGKAAAPPGFDLLQKLPQEFQSGIAAGFELTARKPGATR